MPPSFSSRSLHLRTPAPWIVPVAFVGLLVAQPLEAANQFWLPLGVDDWYATTGGSGESDNWDNGFGEMFVPSAEFDEIGTINNGGTAFVNIVPDGTVAEPHPGGVLLGEGAADSGYLEILTGGSLTAVPWDSDGSNGAVVIGGSGLGIASVDRGGLLGGESLVVGGAASSSLTLGGGNSGTATVQISGNAALNRTTRVIGPNVDFLAGGDVSMGGQSTLVAEITSGAAHSALRAAGTAQLGGTLRVEFDAVSPQVGDTWTLVDAGSISGAFGALDLSAAPEVAGGGAYKVTTVSGGLGETLQLSVSQLLTLRVNWDDGHVYLENQGSTPVEIDGYSVLSSLGALNDSQGVWTSLSDEPVAGWEETATSENAISELHQSGSTSLGGGFSKDLGALFSPVFPAFGESPEDLVLEYREADGSITQGLVQFEGDSVVNNLRLTIDPETGEAQLKNDSPYAVTIDGYSVLSEAGALVTGAFDGLGLAGWQSAAPSPNALSELLQSGSLTLSPGRAFELGEIYDDPGSTRDLVIEFNTSGGPSLGVVTYGTITEAIDGDFNSDGFVDAADYTVWRDGLGELYTIADYLLWKENFGSGAAAATSTPEPASCVVAVFLFSCGLPLRRRSSTR